MSLCWPILTLPLLLLTGAAPGNHKTDPPQAAAAQFVTPKSSQVTFADKSYIRQEMEYDSKTKVWTVYFDKKSAQEAPDDGLIFNFYGWNPPTDAKTMAETWRARRDSTHMIFAFQAPDGTTGEAAFFLISETLRLDKGYAYANISKIASIDGGAYAITFNHRIHGVDAAKMDNSVKAWLLSDEGKAAQSAIGSIGINNDWKGFLAKQRK